MNDDDRSVARTTNRERNDMNEQLIVKLTSLSTNVEQGFRRLDEKMNRFQSDLHDAQLAHNDKMNLLDKEMNEKFALKRARVDDLEKRIIDIEKWEAVAMAKVTAIVSAAAICLTLFAPAIRAALGVPG